MKKTGLLPLIFVITMSGCSKNSDGLLKIGNGSAITEGETEQEEKIEDLPYLSAKEAYRAKEPAYKALLTNYVAEAKSFNWVSWPISCTGEVKECADTQSSVGLRDVTVVGEILVLDPKKDNWWKGLNGARNLRSLRIEADKVVVRGSLYLPSTNVRIVADSVIFEENGLIDVTPIKGPAGQEFKDGATKAENGADGISGSFIEIIANFVSSEGSKNTTHLIARGGRGGDSGLGKGQTKEQFTADPHREADREVLPTDIKLLGDISYYNNNRQLMEEVAKGVIFSGEHWDLTNSVMINCLNIHQHIKPCANQSELVVQRGSQNPPAAGIDAVAGGIPGAGGKGGSVYIFTKFSAFNSDIPKSFVDVRGGDTGTPDVDRYGSLAGFPNPSYKLLWGAIRSPKGYQLNVYKQVQPNGKHAASPKMPISLGVDSNTGTAGNGNLVTRYSPKLEMRPPVYWDLKLRQIKELYFRRDFDSTIALVNDIDAKIKNQGGLTEANAATKIALENIRTNLISEKDFYGRGLKDAPAFAFEFNLDQYKAQVKQAMINYYLAAVFTKSYKDSKAREEAISTAISEMGKNLEKSIAGVGETYQLMNTVFQDLNSVTRKQTEAENDLKQIELQIKQMAELTVAERERARKLAANFKLAMTICKIVPVGQPALGAAATLVEGMMTGPKEKSVAGWTEYLASMRDSYNGAFDSASLGKSMTSWNDFWGKFDKGHFIDKDWETRKAWAEKLYKGVSPIVDKVGKEINAHNSQPTLGSAEVQAEIERIKQSDFLFVPVATKLSALIEEKEKLAKNSAALMKELSKLLNQVNDYTVVSSRLSDDATKFIEDDGVLMNTFAKMSANSEEQLNFLFDEATRSYHYITLEPYPQQLSLVYLRQKVAETMEKSTSTENAIEILTSFYISQLNGLRDAMRTKLRDGSPLLRLQQGSNIIDLTEDEVAKLNQFGQIEIPLEEDFYFGRSNVRISNVEAANGRYSFQKNEGIETGRFPAVILHFSLDKKGDVKMNDQKETFFYSNSYIWQNTFQFRNGTEYFEKNSPSKTTSGIISGLIDDPAVLKYSNIFTQHAGLTKLIVKLEDMKSGRQLNKLSIQVNYDYSLE